MEISAAVHRSRSAHDADFAGIGLAASNIRHQAHVVSTASAEAIEQLLAHTDTVAEIHNTIRTDGSVTRD